MPTRWFSFAFPLLLALPVAAQKRAAAAKEPTFPEAIEQAQKAYGTEDYGAAVTALQAALRQVQKKQRSAVLEALPKLQGYTVRDDDPASDGANPFASGLVALGMSVTRHYEGTGAKAGKDLTVEVMANSPMVTMMAMMLSNPAIAKADGAEIVEYGKHKALLKKSGDGHELSIVMFDKHLIKVTAQALSADEVLAVFDQAFVDRVEKPLGK